MNIVSTAIPDVRTFFLLAHASTMESNTEATIRLDSALVISCSSEMASTKSALEKDPLVERDLAAAKDCFCTGRAAPMFVAFDKIKREKDIAKLVRKDIGDKLL